MYDIEELAGGGEDTHYWSSISEDYSQCVHYISQSAKYKGGRFN